MNILRWLMKHPILLAWLLAIIAILLNFSMSGKPVEHGQTVAEHGQKTGQHAAPAAAPQVVEAAPAAMAPQQPVPVPAQGAAEVAVIAGEAQQPAAAVQAQSPAPAEAPAPVPAPQQAAAPVVEQPADLLRAAREAYWSNELDNAVEFYTSLLKQAPDSIEYKGELANVYWKQGNAKKAAELFTEIAPKLAAQGRTTEAFNMKLYVDMVDPELAKQIDAALPK
ncbi:tetratricopeptide repeat protein [Candidatus Thiothrix sp. Deng01]|uniref:Tetratricopeptide repeat protein n=1 Tax=Candidatus Thiothrix phosphatis TaxID=3112415 RepID=A0ABU6CZB6_9GAMM|nr:tetratricopeptide repeat protein [Candidatus Thiothrix sp. Deng01]MEB4592171.1 tetratricopeptide repeat protein [Candidatus Thiothrix sp. Deng01]